VAVTSAEPYANWHLAQTDNHASTPSLSFLQAGCRSYCLTNGVKALKAKANARSIKKKNLRRLKLLLFFLQSLSGLVHDMQIWLRCQERNNKQPVACVHMFENGSTTIELKKQRKLKLFGQWRHPVG